MSGRHDRPWPLLLITATAKGGDAINQAVQGRPAVRYGDTLHPLALVPGVLPSPNPCAEYSFRLAC